MSYRILLVSDDASLLQTLQQQLAVLPCVVEAFRQPKLALARARSGRRRFDLVMAEYQMPDMDGVALIRALKEEQADMVAILLSSLPDLRLAMEEATATLVYRHITKPWDADQLRAIVSPLMAPGFSRGRSARRRESLPQASAGKGALARLEQKYPGITLPGFDWHPRPH